MENRLLDPGFRGRAEKLHRHLTRFHPELTNGFADSNRWVEMLERHTKPEAELQFNVIVLAACQRYAERHPDADRKNVARAAVLLATVRIVQIGEMEGFGQGEVAELRQLLDDQL